MEPQLIAFVEHFGLNFEQYGSRRTSGRRFAVLLTTNVPQSLQNLADQPAVSKSPCSLTVRQALPSGLVEKVTKAEDRQDYYGVPDNARGRSTLIKLQILTRWRHVAEDGLKTVSHGSPAFQRLQSMLKFFEYLFEQFVDFAKEGVSQFTKMKEAAHD